MDEQADAVDAAVAEILAMAEARKVSATSRQPLEALAGRWRSPVAKVAVVGEVSVGKSTLINALVDAKVLPTAAEPLSSVPVELKYGPHVVATVHIFDGVRPDVRQFVGAQDISDHLTTRGERVLRQKYSRAARVLGAEVSVPSELLASGVSLVDTPGVGGLDPAHRRQTLATLTDVDAVLFAFLPDRPLNAHEIAFLAESVHRVGSYIIVQTHRDHTGDALARLESVQAKLRLPETWAEVVDGDAQAGELAARFADVRGVAVSAKLALEADRADGREARSAADPTGLADLREAIREEIVEKAVEIHRADMLRLTRSTAEAVTTRLDDLMELLNAGDETAKPIREREDRVLEWIERNGDNWKSDLHTTTAEVQVEVTELANERIRLLRRSYRDKFPTMNAEQVEAEVRQMVTEPENLLIEMRALVRLRLTESVTRIIAARPNHRVAKNLDLIRTAADVSRRLPAAPDVAMDLSDAYASPTSRVDAEDYTPMATVGATVFARQYIKKREDQQRSTGPEASGAVGSVVVTVGAILTSSTVLVPIALAAVLFTAISRWRRRRADTVAAAQQAYAEVETAILTTALPNAVDQANVDRDALIALIEDLTAEEQQSIARDREDLDWVANLSPAELLDLMDDIDRDRCALDRCEAVLSRVEKAWSR
ncbi:dynamin family protein [Actinosynnema sp. NPDC059797]